MLLVLAAGCGEVEGPIAIDTFRTDANLCLYPDPSEPDGDGDGRVDRCDVDDDGDGLVDTEDNCPGVQSRDGTDLDGDGLGAPCDDDDDGDGVLDAADNCPALATTNTRDGDGDGIGDACDRLPTVGWGPGGETPSTRQ